MVQTSYLREININMLFEDGLRLVLARITTFSELQRIPRGDYKMKSVKEILKATGME